VYGLILNLHIGRVWETDPSPSSPVGNFLTPKQTPMEIWALVSRSPRRYRHLEFLIHLLIGPIFKTPSWIWKTIESIVLETIAYCLSRLLIGYRPYERPIVVLRPIVILSLQPRPVMLLTTIVWIFPLTRKFISLVSFLLPRFNAKIVLKIQSNRLQPKFSIRKHDILL